MEFGTAQRQQVTDPHSDVKIDPPALRVTPRDTVLQKKHPESGFTEGFNNLGSTLGQALQKHSDSKKAIKKEQLEQETIARNSLETSVHKEDEKLKRTGWGLELYGQNPQYALAQGITAKNAVNQRSMEMNSSIDEYTEMHPDVFKSEVLTKQLDEILAGYDNDPETRQALSKEWFKQVPNIVRNQYESWYGNAQQKIFDSTKTSILTNADNWHMTIDNALNSGDDDIMKQTYSDATQFIQGGGKPQDMSEKAWRNAKLDATSISLAAGNKNLYDIMKHTGQFETQSTKEASQIKTALNAYDIKFKQSIDSLYADTTEQLEYTDSLSDASEIITQFLDELKGAELYRSTGSEHAKLTIQRGERNAALAEKKKEREINRLLLGVSKAEVKKLEHEKLVDSFNLPFADKISTQSQHSVEETQKALDEHLFVELEKYGVDTENRDAVGAQIIRNPELSLLVAKKLSKENVKSPMFKSMIKAAATGWENLFDKETGKLNEDGALILGNINKFKALGALDKYMSQTDTQDLEFITTRLNSGAPLVSIQKDLVDFKNKRTEIHSGVYKQSGQTQLDADLQYVNKIAQSIYGQPVSRSEQFKLREQYREGLSMYDNDHEAASKYVRARLSASATVVNGDLVQNAEKVSEFPVSYQGTDGKTVTETLSLEAVLNQGNTELTPFLAIAKGLSPEDYLKQSEGTSLKDQSLRVFVDDEDPSAIYIDFPDGIQAVRIPQDSLQFTANAIQRKKQLSEEVKSRINLSYKIPQWQQRITY